MAHHSSVILSYWLTSPEIKQNVWKISTASIFLTPPKSQFETNTYLIEIVLFCFCFCYFSSCADLIWFCRNKAQHCYNIWMGFASMLVLNVSPCRSFGPGTTSLKWVSISPFFVWTLYPKIKWNSWFFSTYSQTCFSTHISWTNLLFVNIF